MILILICLLSVNPFYEANFSSLPMRSVSVFSNPGGIGINTGAEAFFTYHPDKIMAALLLGNTGAGIIKIDTIKYYEIAVGYKLPGAISLGYAYQFGDTDTTNHIFGLICHASPKLSLGYRTTIGDKKHMFGGITIKPFQEYLFISGDIEYEGIDSIRNYYYGAIIQPMDGLKMNFYADQDFNWNAGLELCFGKIKLAGAYSKADEKFSAGIIISAQDYKPSLLKPRNNLF